MANKLTAEQELQRKTRRGLLTLGAVQTGAEHQ